MDSLPPFGALCPGAGDGGNHEETRLRSCRSDGYCSCVCVCARGVCCSTDRHRRRCARRSRSRPCARTKPSSKISLTSAMAPVRRARWDMSSPLIILPACWGQGAGYQVTRQSFDYNFYEELAAAGRHRHIARASRSPTPTA